ncbi:MAG: hypothetical protein NTX52_14420 [Planctomycetota bacterium]|nr:hypothetical protein [Planctomycetota bacterium]
MRSDILIKDPVFQLNLLLWMAKEQPLDNYRVYPLFHNLKFKIIYIEQPFPFPDQFVKTIQESGLDISVTPEPELILGREEDNKALYFEAKANSFGTDSTNCRQARAHFVASGPAFGEVFTPLDSCLLCYVVPNDVCSMMSKCLTTLKTELDNKGLKTGPFSSHGLAIKGDNINYCWDSAFMYHVEIEESYRPILNEVEENTDPSPLILVFSDEDCSDDILRNFYRQVVIEQVRSCLLCDLHSHNIGSEYETTPDNLLMKTTDGIFQYLGRERQKRLRRLIRENVFKRIFEYWQERQSGIELTDDLLRITWNVIGEKEDFLDWLEDRHMRFDASKPLEEPRTLFDS